MKKLFQRKAQYLLIVLAYLIFQIPMHQLQAKEVKNLFEISIPVESQSKAVRNKVTKKALLEVVVRISGQSQAVDNESIKSKIRKSSIYVQRYLYRDAVITNEQGETSKQLMLDLYFDEQALRKLLREAELPRWGTNRPQVLIWAAIGDKQQRLLMGTDADAMQRVLALVNDDSLNIIDAPALTLEPAPEPAADLQEILNQAAFNRGLPIILPLMDLEDSLAIDVADVWGRFVQPIRQASERYSTDAILAGQIMKQDDVWMTRWLLLHKGRTLSWEQQSATIEQALISGIDSTTNQLAAQYAVFEDSLDRNEILVSISNVEQVEDYAAVMKYLQNLTAISTVNVAKVSGATLQLRLSLIGDQQAMLQSISLNEKLTIESAPFLNNSGLLRELPSLYFRWNMNTRNEAEILD